MKNLILTLIITLPLTLWGQGWIKTFGENNSDVGSSIIQSIDGGYVITGQTQQNQDLGGTNDLWLLKTDENGQEVWSITFGTNKQNEYGSSLYETSNGGFIITGYTRSFGNGSGDVWLIKTDENGNEQWSKTFGGSENDVGRSVKQTIDGGYIIVGVTESTNSKVLGLVYLIKTDENGVEQWSKIFENYNGEGYSIDQTTDNGFIISGVKTTFDENLEFLIDDNVIRENLIIKTDENGVEQWSKIFSGKFNYNYCYSISQTNDNGYIITGKETTEESGGGKIYLIKLDENGNEIWKKLFGDYGVGFSVKQVNDGGYILTGWIYDIENSKQLQDVFIIKTDEYGNLNWKKTFGGTYQDWGLSIKQTNDNGYILTGFFSDDETDDEDLVLIKTDDQGNITSTFEIPLPNPNRKLEKTINLKGQEIKPQTNQPIIEIFDDGSVEKKIIVE